MVKFGSEKFLILYTMEQNMSIHLNLIQRIYLHKAQMDHALKWLHDLVFFKKFFY